MKARISQTRAGWLPVLALAGFLACSIMLAGGCGLETDKANEYLKQANKHQEEAEAILLRLRAFPNDWQTVFSGWTIGQQQVDGARQLIRMREQDLAAILKALEAWKADLNKILELDVEMQVKEYVNLRTEAINAWKDYAQNDLKPLIKAYSEMVDIIAGGGSAAQQDAKAQEITGLVQESVQRLEECRAADKQADNYFDQNKLGE